MTRVLIVAGEASGDQYGALLAREMRAIDPSIEVLGAGSTLMRDAGVEILADPTRYASIGFIDAVRRLREYAALYRRMVSALTGRRPDIVVPIDFPEFNLRLAPRAVERGIPVVYFIPPQIWAWRPGRIHQIRRVCRKVIVLLPFEEKYFRERGVDASFVGHPLLDVLSGVRPATDLKRDGPLVAVLPGSRRTQYAELLPRMAAAARLMRRKRPDLSFVIAGAPTLDRAWAERVRREAAPELPIVWDRTREIMAACDAGLIASGTSTIEATILRAPMVVTYWVHPLAALIAAPLLHVKHYSLANILAGRTIVPELYQFRAQPPLLAQALEEMLDPARNAEVRRNLAEVTATLGPPGAARRAAEQILRVGGVSVD